MMEDANAAYSDLHMLADELGIQRRWRDVNGRVNSVADDAIGIISAALGYPASSAAEIAQSLESVRALKLRLPKLITGEVGTPIPVPAAMLEACLTDADARKSRIALEGFIPPVAKPGYYELAIGDHRVTLAVSPRKFDNNLNLLGRRLWGPSIQVPALRRQREREFGNLGDLHDCVEQFAKRGADAVQLHPWGDAGAYGADARRARLRKCRRRHRLLVQPGAGSHSRPGGAV